MLQLASPTPVVFHYRDDNMPFPKLDGNNFELTIQTPETGPTPTEIQDWARDSIDHPRGVGKPSKFRRMEYARHGAVATQGSLVMFGLRPKGHAHICV